MGWEVALRAVLSLLLVFGLIAGAGLLVRRIGARGGLIGRRLGKRRLSLLETLPLDNRRRLVLIQHDNQEHLLLLGGGSDLLLQSSGARTPAFSLSAEDQKE